MISGVGGAVPGIVKSPLAGAVHGAERKGDAEENVGAARPSHATETSPHQHVQPTSEGEKTKNSDPEDLSEEEQRQVADLKRRDAEVRAHEQAHSARGGAHASAPSYEYTVGPDGKRYATSGEVKIDASPVRDNPEATIRKMEAVIAAALAPADPSSQDLQVARQAQEQRAKAQVELTKKREAERDNNSSSAVEAGGANDESAQSAPSASTLLQANAAYSQDEEEKGTELANQVFSLSQQISISA